MKLLSEAVKRELKSGRIGVPVFVRCVAQVSSDRAHLSDTANEIVSLANEWLRSSPDRLHIQGSERTGQLTKTLRYAGGQSALISAGLAMPSHSPQVDLTIIGNKGAIYHDGISPMSTVDSKVNSISEETSNRPKSSKTYGVLLIAGLRTHQENYAQLFASDPRCRLIAVADESEVPPHRSEWNRKFAEELKLPYIQDLDAALKRKDVDIVSICAEHERRGRVAVRCAQAGKHLYIDKPMTCSIKDADEVVAAVKRSGVKSQVFSFVHYPWAQAAKKALESEAVGKLIAIHSDVLFAKGHSGTAPLASPRKQDPSPVKFTFIDSKRELRATGVYALSLIKWLTQRQVKSVYGITANYFFKEHAENDVEDFGLISMTLDKGITATITGGRIGWLSHPHSGPNRLYLIGTKGALRIDAYWPKLEVCSSETPWTPPPVNPSDPMGFWQSTQKEVDTQPKKSWIPMAGSANDASRFIDYIEAGVESQMSAQEGAEVVKALMIGYVSAASGEEISLPLRKV